MTTLPLKAGSNVIYVHTPDDYISQSVDNGLDGVDVDVIHVTAAGTGTGPNVTPVAQAN